MPERVRHDGALTTDTKKASPDDPGEAFYFPNRNAVNAAAR
jgi:hypothetical protein